MGLLGGDLWDEIIDPHDRKKKRKDWTPQKKKENEPSENRPVKSKVSGLTIFYRTIGSFILIGTMIKSWITAPTIFDWVLLLLAILLIGIHRRFGAEYVVGKLKPAFVDLHTRLKKIEDGLAEKINE